MPDRRGGGALYRPHPTMRASKALTKARKLQEARKECSRMMPEWRLVRAYRDVRGSTVTVYYREIDGLACWRYESS